MKNKTYFLILSLILIDFGLASNAGAAKEGEWVRIPSQWLLSRFVRPSTAPAHTYKVAIVVPPGSKQAKIAQSSGRPDVDTLAADYAMVSILMNGSLKDLAKTKELYFQFVVTPPMLDVKMRSKEGQRPPPPGKELYTPLAENFYTDPNQNEVTSRKGEMVVVFPPSGGYAVESIVTVSTGNPAADRYFLHNAALNWQTTQKSSTNQFLRKDFGVRRPTRWESILDH